MNNNVNLLAKRVSEDNSYRFKKIKCAKKIAKDNNTNMAIIDMGIGEPDEMAFPEVVQTLLFAAGKQENRLYADNGGNLFKKSIANYMHKVYDVKLDPYTEIIHSIGSKAALSILPACFINPGDVVLSTAPGYPIFSINTKYYGGEVYNSLLFSQNNYFPNLGEIPASILERAKILLLNYPNNPTGAFATIDFFKEAISFASKYKLLIVQDAAYSALSFGYKPLSILSIKGGKDVAIEAHTLSKAFNMTGWRIGWLCGNSMGVRAYADVKNNSDSGQFLAIQEAAATALTKTSITETIAIKYSRRMDLMIKALYKYGFTVLKPKGGFYLYTKAPKSAISSCSEKITFATPNEFSLFFIHKLLISTIPWYEAGSFIRLSATFTATSKHDEINVIDQLKSRLNTYVFEF